MRTSNHQASVWFIFVTLLIDITGWGLIIPVLPQLIEKMIHGGISQAAWYGGWLSTSYALMQFFCAPIVGSLSDQYGRRPVLLISLLGFAIDYLFLSFANTVVLLFIGRIIAGLTGASITTASAYIADVSNDKNRAKNFGLIGAAFGVGFILGPVLGGLLGHFGERVPFMVAAALCFINFLYGYFALPESLDKEHRRRFEWKKANPIEAFIFLRNIKGVNILIVSLTLMYIASHAVNATWSFFTIEKFRWDSKMIGISLGVVGFLVGGVQGGLIRFTQPLLGNAKSIYTGLLLYALGLAFFAFATQSWMMFAFLLPYCLGGIAAPSLQAVIAEKVSINQQGKLQGALTSLMSATSIIGPLMMTGLFHFFTKENAHFYFPGAAFLAGSILMLISSSIAYRVLRKNI